MDMADSCQDDERKRLRSAVASMTLSEELAPNKWLLRSGENGECEYAIIITETLKPVYAFKEPGSVDSTLGRALEGSGNWFKNDRFHKQTAVGGADVCFEVVYPATAKDIAKHRQVALVRVIETPALYKTVTVPRTLVGAEARDSWVVNIIEGRKEVENVVPELSGNGLVIVKDYKWQDMKNTDELYYQCLFSDTSVRSLRNLTGDHVPILKRIRDTVVPGLALRHGLESDSLMTYVHYHPTFWYFHVHVVNTRHTMFTREGQSMFLSAMDRFHKLETVLALVEANGAHYAEASLPLLLSPAQAAHYTCGAHATSGNGVKRPAPA
eukprot:TRINITY_DN54554_c0_g1_i1.p1 TRINITY_DN54554_c0_g1~~TRINITY_DN54554_c0_g1_i1.p1  ORF type:complete len:334 (-),score=42.28 TRINITY_DN54554_c0_g1_i1:7-981(-)